VAGLGGDARDDVGVVDRDDLRFSASSKQTASPT
jgi:hypothetical protein